MILTGPSNAQFGPPPAPAVTVISLTFDLIGHTFTVLYQPAGGGNAKSITGAIPAAVQTNIEAHAKNVIEADQGWANGSSTITAP